MAKSSNSDPDMDPPQFGRFYLREMLNSGGMSEIWLVADNRNRPYALRKLKRELRFNFTARRRFLRGCEILAKLTDSDHIVDYVEHGKAEGTCYLVMTYVEAENLKVLQARQDPLLAEHLAQILIDAATGLSDVHESGYMHLDFKPENILVTRNGAVRLIDFDMAQPIPEKPVKFSKNPGTPGYMAPEQLKREPMDARADIYAFGVMAYELVTNQKPFPGDSPAEILACQMQPEGPVAPREHNPSVPPALETVILKCLARDPDHRYAIGGMLARDLQTALYV